MISTAFIFPSSEYVRAYALSEAAPTVAVDRAIE
jgi:hypothetical protein